MSISLSLIIKALNPDIWPLRVKVREFIHYARKNPSNRQQYGGPAQQVHVQCTASATGSCTRPATTARTTSGTPSKPEQC